MKIRTDAKAGSSCYIVRSGDNLSLIAQRFYGSQSQDNVMKIYYSNQQAIGPNPSLIRTGMNLYLPD
jgi:nucleoid-associated protein YgaU